MTPCWDVRTHYKRGSNLRFPKLFVHQRYADIVCSSIFSSVMFSAVDASSAAGCATWCFGQYQQHGVREYERR